MNDDKKKKNTDGGVDPVTGVVQEYKAEFRRIVWPSKQVLFKHTVTVVAVSALFGAYIALMDFGFGLGLRQFIQVII